MPATARQVRAYRERLFRRALAAVGAGLGMLCQRCGRVRACDFAHIAATGLCGEGRGQYRRWLDVVRNPDCYRYWCKRCHLTYDAPPDCVGGRDDEIPY